MPSSSQTIEHKNFLIKEALLILVDQALDQNDQELFVLLSKEIKKLKDIC